METLSIMYWSRACLGIGTGLLCVLLNVLSPGLTIFSNISVAIIVYLITYYIYKWRFSAFVTKSSKIITQGIGAYFLTWVVALGLFVTILHPAAAFTYSPEFPIVDNEVTFNSASSRSFTGYIVSFEWDFGDENTTTLTDSTISHVYATAGNYTVNLMVTNNYGFSTTISDIVSVEAPE